MAGSIPLTKDEIVSVIHSGTVEQSELAEVFISAVKQELGLEIFACYASSHERMVIPPPKPSKIPRLALFRRRREETLPSDPDFEDSLHLSIYVRDSWLHLKSLMTEEMKQKILAIFERTLAEHHVEVSYPRLFTPQEDEYDGFCGKRGSERDQSKIIQPKRAPIKRSSLSVDSFEGLALWHIYSDSCNSISNFLKEREQDYPSIRVCCGWDEKKGQECIHLCFALRSELINFLIRPDAPRIKEECVRRVQKHDLWGLVTPESYAPILKVWSELDDEEKFRLLSG